MNKEYNRSKHRSEIIRHIRRKNTEKVLKHCFLGGDGLLLADLRFSWGFWNLIPGKWRDDLRSMNRKKSRRKIKQSIAHCKARGGLKLTSTRYVVSVCSLTVFSCLKRRVVSILQNTGPPWGSFLIDSVTRNVPWLCMRNQLLRTFCSPAHTHNVVECGPQTVHKILAVGMRDFFWKHILHKLCSKCRSVRANLQTQPQEEEIFYTIK